MKLDEKVLRKLEYHKIIKMLEEKCSSIMGKELASTLQPSFNLEEIVSWQSETTQAKEVMRLFPNFSLGGIRDIRSSIDKANIGGIVEPSDFLMIYDTLVASRSTKNFFKTNGQKYQLLVAYTKDVVSLPQLEQEIKRNITTEGEVSDNASPELSHLRKKLRSLQGRAREKLENMVRSQSIQKYLQDFIITIRNDRYVIPIKQEYRSQVPGIIHDQSASGATLFVEPMSVVEINSETQQVEAMEKAEVTRILREMSQLVATYSQELKDILATLAQLDFIFGKGKLSSALDCGEPIMNQRGYIRIIQGRHPLLKGTVVPTTIWLGQDFETLVITGPNTGGKTVALKTVGLFVLMAQAGLHVPAQVGTEISLFEGIFADIGDEQSIEQSLSTFSSHMTNIVSILQKANARSLVLMDELGAGTDPTEGAALAMAILEYFVSLGTKVIATTHYSELKSFAYNNERVENASVEFDVETLRPTYRLLVGVPGKSNAFEISRRLGLKQELVERAKGLLSKEEVRVADLIENLETNQLLSERDRQEAKKLKLDAREQLSIVEGMENEVNRKKDAIIKKAQQEALEIVTKVRRESEAILKEVRGIKKKAEAESQEELQEIKEILVKKETHLLQEVFQETDEGLDPDKLEIGDMVLIKRINQKAQVLKMPNESGEVFVQAGVMKVLLKLKDISKINEEKKEKKKDVSGIGRIVSTKARDIKNELDLRGLSVDEAIFETEKYLDDVFLAGLPNAYIIHGKGTGALRNAIKDLVNKHRFVTSSRIGGYNEGGNGVTVVEMRYER